MNTDLEKQNLYHRGHKGTQRKIKNWLRIGGETAKTNSSLQAGTGFHRAITKQILTLTDAGQKKTNHTAIRADEH
jgi:hypothetical protein